MIVTAVLVRWTEGWHDVTDTAAVSRWGRKEAMLGLGAVQSLSEVETVSREQLAIFGDPLTEISCDTFPVGPADTPYIAYRPGDRVVVPDVPGKAPAAERVQAITVTMDDNGHVTYATDLRDVLMDERERFAETLTKMANGTLGGYSKVAQPATMVPAPAVHSTYIDTGGGFTAETTATRGDTVSDNLYSVPPGSGTYTLTRFYVRPSGDGPRDEIPVYGELWQVGPESGNYMAARVNIGTDYQAGVEYEDPGGVIDDTLIFDVDNAHGLQFRAAGEFASPLYMAAEFEGGGTVVTVEWVNPTLRVIQGRR
jgi:hypothetical protein